MGKSSLTDLAVALEADAVGAILVVDEHLHDVGAHGDVQVGPVAHRPQERLGRGAARAAPDRPLRRHETRLRLAVDVAHRVPHLHGSGQEGRRQRRLERRLLHG